MQEYEAVGALWVLRLDQDKHTVLQSDGLVTCHDKLFITEVRPKRIAFWTIPKTLFEALPKIKLTPSSCALRLRD